MIFNNRIFKAQDIKIILGQKTLVMGIVNVTPDSFSDGGETYSLENAVNCARQMEADGADIIDIGGESTRPGSESVSLDEELRRIIPVIEALQDEVNLPISIDTYKAEVAYRAMEAGANIINDISAGTFDPQIPALAAEFGAGVILMHIKGTPRDMQRDPKYDNLMLEISTYLDNAVERFVSAGVSRDSILVDPGIGFGKLLEHNLELMRRAGELRKLAAGVLLGPSRKSFLGLLTGAPVKDRVSETISAAVTGALCGADVIRVHDVKPVVRALKVADAIMRDCG